LERNGKPKEDLISEDLDILDGGIIPMERSHSKRDIIYRKTSIINKRNPLEHNMEIQSLAKSLHLSLASSSK
jgi:hypothetical protein